MSEGIEQDHDPLARFDVFNFSFFPVSFKGVDMAFHIGVDDVSSPREGTRHSVPQTS